MRRASRFSILATPVLAFVAITRLAACVGDDASPGGGSGTLPDGAACALGSESCGCTSGGACDPGLSCVSKTCVAIGTDAPSGNETSTGEGGGGGEEDASKPLDAGSDGTTSGVIQFAVMMTPGQEVPAANSKASSAAATLLLDTVGKELKGAIAFSGLDTAATAAHIHAGNCGANGAVAHALEAPVATGGTLQIDWTGMTPDDITKAVDNGLYVNIHTQSAPAGEIRGQIIRVGSGATCP